VYKVRYVPKEAQVSYEAARRVPFGIQNAPNVFLETIKRGEDDDFSKPSHKTASTTLILRVFEAYGGHAHAHLSLGHNAPITKAFTTNLLEEEGEELKMFEGKDGTFVKLDFHGFEVKTIKLVLKEDDGAKT
jgi:alpha-mannosidase